MIKELDNMQWLTQVNTDFGTTPLGLVMLKVDDKLVIYMTGEVPAFADVEPFCQRLIDPDILDAWGPAGYRTHYADLNETKMRELVTLALIPWSILIDDSVWTSDLRGNERVYATALAEQVIFAQPLPIMSSGTAHVIPDFRYPSVGHSAGAGGHGFHKDYLVGRSAATSYIIAEYADRAPDSWDTTKTHLTFSGKFRSDQTASLATADGRAYCADVKQSAIQSKALPWFGPKLGTDKGLNKRLAEWVMNYYTANDAYPFVWKKSPRAAEKQGVKGGMDAAAIAMHDREPSRRVAMLRRQSVVAGACLAYGRGSVWDRKYKAILTRDLHLTTWGQTTLRNVDVFDYVSTDIVGDAAKAVETNTPFITPVMCLVPKYNGTNPHPAIGYSLPMPTTQTDLFYRGEFMHTEGKDHFYDLRLVYNHGGQGDREWELSSQETNWPGSFAHQQALFASFDALLDSAVFCTPDFVYGKSNQGSCTNLKFHFYSQSVSLPYIVRFRDYTRYVIGETWTRMCGLNPRQIAKLLGGTDNWHINDRDGIKKLFSVQEVHI